MTDVEIKITDNTEAVALELGTKIEAALEAIGNQAVSYAKKTITEASRVDTGALRLSVSHVTDPSEQCVHVGTNQEYAIYHEIGTGIYLEGGGGRTKPWKYVDRQGVAHWTRGIKPIHFIKKAASEHSAEYKKIIEEQLKK